MLEFQIFLKCQFISSKINPTNKDSDFDDSDFALYEKLKAKNKKTLEEKASESKRINLSLKNHHNSKLNKSGSYQKEEREDDQNERERKDLGKILRIA